MTALPHGTLDDRVASVRVALGNVRTWAGLPDPTTITIRGAHPPLIEWDTDQLTDGDAAAPRVLAYMSAAGQPRIAERTRDFGTWLRVVIEVDTATVTYRLVCRPAAIGEPVASALPADTVEIAGYVIRGVRE